MQCSPKMQFFHFYSILLIKFLILGHLHHAAGERTSIDLRIYSGEQIRILKKTFEEYESNLNLIRNNEYYMNREVETDESLTRHNQSIIRIKNLLNELSLLHRQANLLENLTALFITLIVQFYALHYAVQFSIGHYHLHEGPTIKDKSQSKHCLEIAYFLAIFGTQTKPTTDAINTILDEKYEYPTANEEFKKMTILLEDVQKILQENIINNYVSSREDELILGVQNLLLTEYRAKMSKLMFYFEELLFGETEARYAYVGNDSECVDLWKSADSFAPDYIHAANKKSTLLATVVASAPTYVVPILRAIIFKIHERHIPSKSMQRLRNRSMDTFSLVYVQGSTGKLMLTRIPSVLLESLDRLPSIEKPVKEETDNSNLLGLHEYDLPAFGMVLELFNTYDRGFKYANKEKFIVFRAQNNHLYTTDSQLSLKGGRIILSLFIPPPEGIKVFEQNKYNWKVRMDTEIQEKQRFTFLLWESENSYLSDLLSIVFVQFMAMIYSVRFLHGYLHLATMSLVQNTDTIKRVEEDLSQESTDIQMAKFAALAYQMALFAQEITLVVEVIQNVLDEKYLAEENEYSDIWATLNVMVKFVSSVVVRRYSNVSSSTGFTFRDNITIHDKDFETNVGRVNAFFRRLILGKDFEMNPNENMVDIKGGHGFWMEVDTFFAILHRTSESISTNLFSKVEDTIITSNILSIIEHGETLMALRKFQIPHSELIKGFTEEILVLENLAGASSARKLQFTRQPLQKYFNFN